MRHGLFLASLFIATSPLIEAQRSHLGAAGMENWRYRSQNGHWYAQQDGPTSWHAAEAEAQSFGGHLVTVRSAEENQWLVDEYAPTAPHGNGFWLGLTDEDAEGTYTWTSGEPFDYENFNRDHSAGADNDYIHLLPGNGLWQEWNYCPGGEPGCGSAPDGIFEFTYCPLDWLPAMIIGWPTMNKTTAMASADLNNDGISEVVIASEGPADGTQAIHVYSWSDDEQFHLTQAFGGSATRPGLDLGDFDNDGYVDILVPDYNGNVRVYWNEGNGAFSDTSYSQLANGSHDPWSVAAADVNQDGKLDAIFTKANADTVEVYLGDGQRNFSFSLSIGIGNAWRYIGTGDFNEDTFPDLVTCGNGDDHGTTASTMILLNAGDGSFTAAPALAPISSYNCEIVDINSDGHLDLVTSEKIFAGVGDGTFIDTRWDNLGGGSELHTRYISTADFNFDGHLDVAAADGVIHWGTEPFGFPSSTQLMGTGLPFASDVNGDGSVDLLSLKVTNHDLELNGMHGPDCDSDGMSDEQEIETGVSLDCNADGVPDDCQLTDNDCNVNGIPDECDPDCNTNDIPDECDIEDGSSDDCNSDGTPDDCQLTDNDCNTDGVPDECQLTDNDCNANDIPDDCETDCNKNGVPDDCDITEGTSLDCNADDVPDDCQLTDNDCNANDIPDDCETDCNVNGVPDDCDITEGTSLDCNADDVPDECQLTDNDCNTNDIPDECEVKVDCNSDGVPDECQLADNDCDENGVPDECDADCNGNGAPDACDLAGGLSNDCNGNLVPDECDVLIGGATDCNGNLSPDECDISSGLVPDCNSNGIPDSCDIADGTEDDSNDNGVPDSCQTSSDDGGGGCGVMPLTGPPTFTDYLGHYGPLILLLAAARALQGRRKRVPVPC